MKSPFLNDRDVRWCPGCGDYAVLKYLSEALASKGWKPHEVTVVSGIGCSSRLPYYLSCYGFHTIHGRAPAIATGVSLARPEMPLIVITGDGDACSIGLHHYLHAIRRNVPMTILLMNNRVYGLTKGQTSPTSVIGQVTKTDRQGGSVSPLCPLIMALSAGGSWIGRCLDIDGMMMKDLLQKAFDHKGTSVIEVYQNCPVFNDKAFPSLKDRRILADHSEQPAYAQVIDESFAQWGDLHFDAITQEWQPHSTKRERINSSFLYAMGLLTQTTVPVLGLLYTEQKKVFARKAAECSKGYTRAVDKLNKI